MKFTLGHYPAFPCHPAGGEPGMYMREWYAGLAMQGLLAMHADPTTECPDPAKVAAMAFAYADAMLEEARKEPT